MIGGRAAYDRRPYYIQYEALLYIIGSIIVYNRKPYYLQQLEYTIGLILRNRRPYHTQQEALLYMI